MNDNSGSTNYLTQRGEEIYLSDLRADLEANHLGEYAVIEVKSKKYFVNPNLIVALQEAEKAFPNTLFYIVKVGTLQNIQKMVKNDWLHREQSHIR